jgi:hypothetical protein
VSTPEDEDPIEAVVADGAYPALGERVRVRRLHGRPDHLDSLAAKDLVESPAELAVTVVDQQPERPFLLAQLHREITRLLRHPGSGGIRRAGHELDSTGREREEEEHIDPPQPDRLDGEEVTGEHAGGLLAQERAPRLACPLGRGRNAGARQDLAHGRR